MQQLAKVMLGHFEAFRPDAQFFKKTAAAAGS
jgi:hypothetical protein